MAFLKEKLTRLQGHKVENRSYCRSSALLKCFSRLNVDVNIIFAALEFFVCFDHAAF